MKTKTKGENKIREGIAEVLLSPEREQFTIFNKKIEVGQGLLVPEREQITIIDKKIIEQKRIFIERLRAEIELEIEEKKAVFVREIWKKIELMMDGITLEKAKGDPIKYLTESVEKAVKTFQLISDKPTEIRRTEYTNMTEEELDEKQRQIEEMMRRYNIIDI